MPWDDYHALYGPHFKEYREYRIDALKEGLAIANDIIKKGRKPNNHMTVEGYAIAAAISHVKKAGKK